MQATRKIRMILKRQPTMEGAGVHLNRVFGYSQSPQLDPFLMLDDFRSDTPAHYLKGFPWHPHRGIETITYVTKGDVEHGDSLGNTGVISSGDVQWMTAGSGIIHQEMPKGDANGAMHGFQLWANLPAAQKMMAPRYRGITADQIPAVELENGVTVKVIAGSIGGARGPWTTSSSTRNISTAPCRPAKPSSTRRIQPTRPLSMSLAVRHNRRSSDRKRNPGAFRRGRTIGGQRCQRPPEFFAADRKTVE
jgi:redox-sensitive bicupin YhaK (pirin superfamily)